VNIYIGKQYLPHVVPLAFASCNLDDGSAVDIDESDDENINGFGGVSSDDEAHDEPRVRNISIRTGVLDEKAAATQALGLFAEHTKSSYAPYLFTSFIYFNFFFFYLTIPGVHYIFINKGVCLFFVFGFLNLFKLFGGVTENFGKTLRLFS
jgi:hypothetical protein